MGNKTDLSEKLTKLGHGPGNPLRASLLILTLSLGTWLPQTALAGPEARYTKGCAQFLTVQSRSCEVEQLWRCPDARTGPLRSVIYDGEGLAGVSLFNDDLQLLEINNFPNRKRYRLHRNSKKLNSLERFLADGEDHYDVLMQDQRRRRDGLHFVGRDKFNGNNVEIDGEALQELEFEYVLTMRRRGRSIETDTKGVQYYSPKYRYIFSGKVTRERNGEIHQDDNRPFLFTEPGENGFDNTRPVFGCGDLVELEQTEGNQT